MRAVSDLAARFSAGFGGESLAACAGRWHDLGKFASEWQQFLIEAGENAASLGEDTPTIRRSSGKRGPDHSTAGAIHARLAVQNALLARAVSLIVASHHAGLPDLGDHETRLVDETKTTRYRETLDKATPSILELLVQPQFPTFFPGRGSHEDQYRRFEFLVRMLYSAVVDADFLDTEAFVDEGPRRTVRSEWPALEAYREPLLRHLEELSKRSTASQPVREARANVVRWCAEAASTPRGAFTLTVPTGGGKTLASLRFAIEHALTHGIDRVIIALPFLSVLDQTAEVLRNVFSKDLGARVLVEHHSNLTPEKDTLHNRLAAENWDAPIVVTTQVQLFESLFARRSSACRKLHNLANSVIVLDEVQTLPVGLLAPILDVLQELRANYRATLLLTTATQPSLHSRKLGATPFTGLEPPPTEIVPSNELAPLFDSLRRVDVEWPQSDEARSWGDLAKEIASSQQVLAIVHRRKDAADLWVAVNELTPGTIHLSALMCPAHRREILSQIRQRLASGETCRVVSTQLVEAGVDVDFPVVYRAMAGLESLAQSAGRCNREGRLPRGAFRVFRASTEPVGSMRHHKQVADAMLAGNSTLDLFAPATFHGYFDRLYAERERDAAAVQVARSRLLYEETASKFRMIDSAAETVFVPYGGRGARAIDAVRYAGPSRERFRALQSYGVAVYPDALRKLAARGAIELLHDSVWVLTSINDYSHDLGLLVEREGFDSFIV
ncbi:MAG: CRISPR-associated helicase Cas3' [Thermoanaerobaculia bacterium]